MIRLTTAIFVAFALIAATSWGAISVVQTQQQHVDHDLLQARLMLLQDERQRWQLDQPSVSAAGTSSEAIRTLDLLNELYAQEERLWAYYDAVTRSHTTRSELAQEEAALTRRVAEHRRQLERLEHTIDHLRPASDPTALTFVQP